MLDVFNFLFIQVGNVFGFLDSFVVFGNLSLLRIIIIVIIFDVALNFLFAKGSDKK